MSDRLKVLFVVDNLGAGGAERSLHELLLPLERSGVVPVLACFARKSEGVEHLVADRYPLHVVGRRSRPAQMLRFRELARAEKPDLIHTSLFEADVYARPAFARLGIPVVTSLVNMPYESARLSADPNVNRAKLQAARWLEAATGRFFADHFHAITDAVKESAARRLHIPPELISVVHRGRDPARLGSKTADRRARVREALGVSSSRFVVLNAARQEFQKGQRYLIEAFLAFARHFPDAELWIAGRNGNATQELRQAAAGSDRIRFLGHREDVPDLMAAADVFALPSLWEGLGCVLLEALALELPIVSSDLPPVREVTAQGQVARLVPAGDARAIERALLEVASSLDGAARRAVAGRELFESAFTIERSAEGMLALFRRVVREGGATGLVRRVARGAA